MTAVALRGLWGRKLRAILTALAIILGVAMISGTYVLTDTIDKAFNTLFVQTYADTDAAITGKSAFDTDFSQPPPFSEDVLAKVKALPDVSAAAGSVTDFGQLTKKDGEAIDTRGAPPLVFGLDTSEERFNPLKLTSGSWPARPDQVLIDQGTADKQDYTVGDTIGVSTKDGVKQFTISGVAKYGTVDSIGSATFAVFDVPTAQKLFGKVGKLDGIQVAAKEGVSPQQLVDEIKPILPAATQVQTGVQEASDATKDIEGFTKFVRYFLLAFGGIALFVGAFVIFNTLSITVAQRVREFATLRTIGASRRQILGSVILEALVIGFLASVVGLFLGLGLAKGLNGVLVAFGLDLPTAGTVFGTRTIVVSLLAGTLITLIAGLFPAIRATRVPPIAAVREGATLPRSRFARFAPFLAALTTILGILLLVYGSFVNGIGVGQRLGALGVGCLILFVGVALISSHVVKPLASVLGWPARRFGGAAGRLAQENSMRNPNRTASTAAALMIGLALITFVAVLAAGLRDSVGQAIGDQVSADYVVGPDDGFTPFEPSVDKAIASVPGAEAVGVRGDQGKAFGDEENVTGVDPATIASAYVFDWRDGGSNAVLDDLGKDGAVVEQSFANDHELAVGKSFELLTPAGKTVDFTVKGIYEAPPFFKMLGAVTIPAATFDSAFSDPLNLYTFVNTAGGQSPAAQQQLEEAVKPFPSVELDTQAGFIKSQQDSINPFLNLLYVLLALSVIVSLFGIVNTLVLSVFERTRELGMLRAVGMTRRQVRRMIRHESVITASIGAVLGMLLGLFLAGLVTQALSSEGVVFSVPVGSLIIFLVIGVIAGIFAAIFPARRAARLNVLQALQYE
jgi:putative ABC transport system permease protein